VAKKASFWQTHCHTWLLLLLFCLIQSLILWPRLALNSRSSCLCLPSIGTAGVHHHAWSIFWAFRKTEYIQSRWSIYFYWVYANDFPSSLWFPGISQLNLIQWQKLTSVWLSLFPLISLGFLICYFCFNSFTLFLTCIFSFSFFLEIARYELYIKPKHGDSELFKEVEEFCLMIRTWLEFLPL
jgi:hypothetical protein